MPLTSIPDALAQYNANPPSTWNSSASAFACLDACYYLLGNRAQQNSDAGSSLNYESIQSVKKTLETRLGVVAPVSSGPRRVAAAFDTD